MKSLRIGFLLWLLLVGLSSAAFLSVATAKSRLSSNPGDLPVGTLMARQALDIIIRDGRVVDGAGNPWFKADVGILDGKIAKIGDLRNVKAAKTIDATGLYVAPGFIDMHNHSDYFQGGLRNPELRPAKLWLIQGVTTVVLGVDGWGAADLPLQGKDWEKKGMGINAASYVGHNWIRTKVLGISDRGPTSAELAQMKDLVREGMENGAFGLSTGLVYIPGSYSQTDEVAKLAEVVSRYGGIYDTHMRDEMVRLIHEARASGLEITADQYPWPNGAARTTLATILEIPPGMGKLEAMYKNLKGNPVNFQSREERAAYTAELIKLLPADFQSREEQAAYTAQLIKALKDASSREKIKRANEEGLTPGKWIKKWGYGWLRVEHSVKNPQYVGVTIPDIANREGVDPFSIVVKLILSEDEHFVVSIGAIWEQDVVTALKEPWVMFSSDGALLPLGPEWINPRNLGSFARPFRKYVREDKVITLEDAVRKMTGLTAQTLRLRDRGLLREGMWADVTIFDGSRMADKSTYADSLHYPEGVVDVFVNGVLSLENGELTGHRAGHVLFGPGVHM